MDNESSDTEWQKHLGEKYFRGRGIIECHEKQLPPVRKLGVLYKCSHKRPASRHMSRRQKDRQPSKRINGRTSENTDTCLRGGLEPKAGKEASSTMPRGDSRTRLNR